MNKAKNKPAAAKAAAAEAPRPVQNRARDLEDDVFDVAHNTMLRSKVVDQYSSHTSSRAAVRQEWDEGVGDRSVVPTPESMDKEAKSETEREEVAIVESALVRLGQ